MEQFSLSIKQIAELPKNLDRSVQIFNLKQDEVAKVDSFLGNIVKKLIKISLPIKIDLTKELIFLVDASIYGFKVNTYVLLRRT